MPGGLPYFSRKGIGEWKPAGVRSGEVRSGQVRSGKARKVSLSEYDRPRGEAGEPPLGRGPVGVRWGPVGRGGVPIVVWAFGLEQVEQRPQLDLHPTPYTLHPTSYILRLGSSRWSSAHSSVVLFCTGVPASRVWDVGGRMWEVGCGR